MCFASFKKKKNSSSVDAFCISSLLETSICQSGIRNSFLRLCMFMRVWSNRLQTESCSALWLPVSLVLQSESGVPVGFMLRWSWLKSLPLHLIQQQSLTFLFTLLRKVLMTPSLAHKNETKPNPKQQQQQKRSNGKTAKTMKTFSYVITHTYKLQNQQSCYDNESGVSSCGPVLTSSWHRLR